MCASCNVGCDVLIFHAAPLTATYARPPAQQPQYGVYQPPAGLAPAYPAYATAADGVPGPYVYNQQGIPGALPVAYPVQAGGYNAEYNAVVVQYSPGQLEVQDDDISCPIMGVSPLSFKTLPPT
jgi:hypothetical protein